VPPDTSPRDRALALGLSQREVDVLELLASGATDHEIADQLFITGKTASHHVSHILTKLAVRRRGEAGAIAHRLGLGLDAG
jgi:DNA-binding NarL/FixJ family response regulator